MRATLQEELQKYETALPILGELRRCLQQNNNLKGKRIGWHCHLTETTAAAAEVIIEAGAELFLSECNRDTTSQPAVDYMRERGAQIYLGPPASCAEVLKNRPDILCDTGFVLISEFLRGEFGQSVYAGSEITSSGIAALRQAQSEGRLSLPVININNGKLKSAIENFHGVGDGVVDALSQLTGRIWAGRRAAVVGYGAVGSGVAFHLSKTGCAVTVVESDPIRKLIAHYDGYLVSSLDTALAECSLVVTATGQAKTIGKEQWLQAKDGTLFLNVGHWSSELDLDALSGLCSEVRSIAPGLRSFTLKSNQRHVLIATNGSPANVSMLTGSPEPTLIHLTTEVLCMNRLVALQHDATTLLPCELPLPLEIEQQVSVLALKALNIHA